MDLHREGANYAAAVSCILPMAQVVYTGDEDGRVVSRIFDSVSSRADSASLSGTASSTHRRTVGRFLQRHNLGPMR